jgi:benzoyl-CoA reductase/2-hydroxyglutaryl-CoA dehydratase subunit BcrC/BadD/HgdB
VTGLEKPCEIMAVDGTQLGLHNSLSRRIASITEGCKRLKIDGVLDRIHLGCRTVAADSLIIKDAVTEVLDIPVMLVERDDFDPRVCNKEQYRRQLELFKHVLDGKKQTRPAP